jgi:hypothetical protein
MRTVLVSVRHRRHGRCLMLLAHRLIGDRHFLTDLEARVLEGRRQHVFGAVLQGHGHRLHVIGADGAGRGARREGGR